MIRPFMTKYEYALICMERYAADGNRCMANSYRRYLDNLTVEQALMII